MCHADWEQVEEECFLDYDFYLLKINEGTLMYQGLRGTDRSHGLQKHRAGNLF